MRWPSRSQAACHVRGISDVTDFTEHSRQQFTLNVALMFFSVLPSPAAFPPFLAVGRFFDRFQCDFRGSDWVTSDEAAEARQMSKLRPVNVVSEAAKTLLRESRNLG